MPLLSTFSNSKIVEHFMDKNYTVEILQTCVLFTHLLQAVVVVPVLFSILSLCLCLALTRRSCRAPLLSFA